MLYKHVTTEFPNLKAMTMPEFKVYTDNCLWAFVGAAQNAGLSHFSEVTWFVSCFEYLGRLPMGIIHKTHFWLALQASIGVDAPSIVRAYQVLTTFSNYLCTTEF